MPKHRYSSDYSESQSDSASCSGEYSEVHPCQGSCQNSCQGSCQKPCQSCQPLVRQQPALVYPPMACQPTCQSMVYAPACQPVVCPRKPTDLFSIRAKAWSLKNSKTQHDRCGKIRYYKIVIECPSIVRFNDRFITESGQPGPVNVQTMTACQFARLWNRQDANPCNFAKLAPNAVLSWANSNHVGLVITEAYATEHKLCLQAYDPRSTPEVLPKKIGIDGALFVDDAVTAAGQSINYQYNASLAQGRNEFVSTLGQSYTQQLSNALVPLVY